MDLDLFCRVIIHGDMERLKHTLGFNSYRGGGVGIAGTVAADLDAPENVGLLDGVGNGEDEEDVLGLGILS